MTDRAPENPYSQFFDELNKLDPSFGEVAETLLKAFKESGLLAQQSERRPIRANTLKPIYDKYGDEGVQKFVENAQNFIDNSEAMRILTESLNKAHVAHEVKEIDEERVRLEIVTALSTLPLYVRLRKME